MGVIRKITDLQLGSINTTKVMSISTSETAYALETANRAVEITNIGSYSVYYGQSNLSVNSGGIILSNGSKFWDTITDNFVMYLRILSGGVTTNVVAQEYAGN